MPAGWVAAAGMVIGASESRDSRLQAQDAFEVGEDYARQELAIRTQELDYARENDARNYELAREQDERDFAFSQEQFDYSKELDARNLGIAQEQDQYRRGLVDDMMADASVERVGVDELENRLGDVSSDTTRAFLKARGITGRDMARYGITPTGSRMTSMLKSNERDLALADVGARNAVRTGVRGENRELEREESGLTQRARMAGLGLTDTSLGLRSNQLNQNMPLLNQSQLNVNPLQPNAMNNLGNFYSNIGDRSFRDADMFTNQANQQMASGFNTGMTAFGMMGGFDRGGDYDPRIDTGSGTYYN